MGRKRKVQETIEVEKIYLHTDHNSIATGAMNTIPSTNVPPRNRKSKVGNSVIRRSVRLQNSSVSNRSQKKLSLELIDLVEGEENETNHQQGNNTSPAVNRSKLEEKVDYIIQVVDELNSKLTGRETETPTNEHIYKSLYINSQKKNEALMEKNYELIKKLEFANGKIDVYEMMNSRAMGTSNEVILVSRLENDAEAIGLSRPTMQKCISAAANENASPKQKRNYKKRRM